MTGVVLFGLALIWALTSRGYFWPVWIALPLAAGARDPRLVRPTRRAPDAGRIASGAAVPSPEPPESARWSRPYFTAVWAITGHGYFWPVWPILAIAVVLGALTAAALVSSPAPGRDGRANRDARNQPRGSRRRSRTSELRRIERDLHDGAQARLVALGMSLGMAEQKLAEDPDRVGELIAEARAGAEHALRELRDLARGIHPPVLADRGLEAALASLASSTPMSVTLSVDTALRPAPAVETAAYFVVAEALANAAKHAHADARRDPRSSTPATSSSSRYRTTGRRREPRRAPDCAGCAAESRRSMGQLTVTSPPGGPTTIRAELPCAS